MITVSVITPCYNASQYIGEAIQSVLSQTYTDWELLIVDDGSSDDSRDIVRQYMAKDTRIRLIEQPNSGACRARNNGIEHAIGEYIKFLDADDILEPNCLKDQVIQIENLEANQIPFGDYSHITSDGQITSSNVYPPEFLSLIKRDQIYGFFCYWQVLITAPLHRKKLLTAIGGFDTSLPRHQETDLHFRLTLADVQFIYYPTLIFYYREYTSPYRITSNYRNGRIDEKELYYTNYIPKKESLLLKKYQVMPPLYQDFFSKFSFNCARYYFAQKKVNEGMHYLKKVFKYGKLTSFMRFYIFMGKIFGYLNIESLFQLRLEMIGKNSSNKKK